MAELLVSYLLISSVDPIKEFTAVCKVYPRQVCRNLKVAGSYSCIFLTNRLKLRKTNDQQIQFGTFMPFVWINYYKFNFSENSPNSPDIMRI